MQSQLQPQSFVVAASHNIIGVVLSKQKRLDKVLHEHQEALQIFECHSPDSEAVADSCTHMGSVLDKKEDFMAGLTVHVQESSVHSLSNWP